jgi:hypothetical protein
MVVKKTTKVKRGCTLNENSLDTGILNHPDSFPEQAITI